MEVRRVSRQCDIRPDRKLTLFQEEDGDIVVSFSFKESVEFCTSGGGSPNTKLALVKLMEAMEKDEREYPQHMEFKYDRN